MNRFTITMQHTTTTIVDFLNDLNKHDTYLRIMESSGSYNFDRDTVIELFNSIIQKNPLHIVLASCTDAKIRARPFSKNIAPANYMDCSYNSHYVLDGHQRLQSLITGYYGCFNNDKLMYDLSYAGEGERFSLVHKSHSSTSMLRLDKVLSQRNKLPVSNWMFDYYIDNVTKFTDAFTSPIMHITHFNVNKAKSASSKRIYIQKFENTMGVFLSMLDESSLYADFTETCTRLKAFLEMV